MQCEAYLQQVHLKAAAVLVLVRVGSVQEC